MGRKPDDRGDAALETVLATNDAAKIAVAKSMLEASGIECFTRGEGLQSLFGLGRIGGVNPVSGPVELQVAAGDLDQAREVLDALLNGADDESDEGDDGAIPRR